MKKGLFLLIAQPNSYRIAPYIQAAQALGLEVLIASRGQHSLISEIHSGLHIDLEDLDLQAKEQTMDSIADLEEQTLLYNAL